MLVIKRKDSKIELSLRKELSEQEKSKVMIVTERKRGSNSKGISG